MRWKHYVQFYLFKKRNTVVRLTTWSLCMWITTFRLHAASLLRAMRSIEYALPICCCAEIALEWIPRLWFQISFPLWSAAARLSCCCFYGSRHPGFWDFSSTVPTSVVRLTCYLRCLYSPACVEMRITINELYFVLERVVSGVVGVLWDGAGLRLSESDIPAVFLDSLLHGSASFANVNLPHSRESCRPRDPVLAGSTASFGRIRWDRNSLWPENSAYALLL